MTCYEDTEDDKNGNGDDENKQELKNPEADERKMGLGTPRNTEEPQATPLTQSYVSNIFTTQVTNKWVMSTIEDNSATTGSRAQFKHGWNLQNMEKTRKVEI